MKKTVALWLTLCLALGLLSGCAAAPRSSDPEEPPAAETAETVLPDGDLAAATEAQAFAAAMAGWLGGRETLEDPDRTLLCWDMAGWYAAREYRLRGSDLIAPEQIEDFLRSVGLDGDFAPPESWLEYGVVERHAAPDGAAYYAFPQHCREIDAMLGVTTEVSVKPLEDGRVESVVTSHYENGTQESTRFVLSFEPNTDPGSAFACRLTEITPPPPGAETVGELTFTWDELIEANRLRNVFKIYPTVRHFCREHNPEMVTWVYPRGEDLTILTLSDGYASGCFRRASFTWQEREGEGWLASIEEFSDTATDWETQDDYLVNYLANITRMSFEGVEDDRIWTECTVRGGMRERIAVDRGTLVLREIQLWYSDDLPPVTTCFLYDETAPALEYLDSWDGPMRTVTLHWEDFSSGERVTRDESVRIPADWEYLPWQGRWGDYTVWMNEEYTRQYAYPGDGVDYTLYLTTAKG